MLAALNLLYRVHQGRHAEYADVYGQGQADASGTYGDATEQAVAEFQQEYGVGSELGVCDQATYAALSAQSGGGSGT
jgi:peptidoglycan hydrolase-like protein with peptidoglycan-binding domain